MKCNFKHESKMSQYSNGFSYFIKEKPLFTSTHPFWVLCIALISCYFTQSNLERFLITTFSFYSVLLEMLNSSIEITNDRWGCKYNENSKIAKELSGSVTALSRIPLFALSFLIIYKNLKSCNKFTSCD